MSVHKLGVIVFSGFLLFALAPVAPAQSPYQESTKKQTTTQKGTASKDAGKTTKSDTHSTEKSATEQHNKSQGTEKNAHATTAKKTGTEKSTDTKKATGKKTSGLSKEKVRQIQSALKKEGFDPGPIDGVLGPLTITTLRNYQSHHGLEVNGTIDAETENALLHGATASTYRSSSQNQSTQQNPSTRESLGLGAAGTVSSLEDVRQVQQALADLMYNPGEANGIMTAQTQQAIREFQFLNNLPVTGNIDEQTKVAIDSQSRGVDSAQISKTYSSEIQLEKPGVEPEPPSVELEKPGISVEEQTQARTERSTSTSTQEKTYSNPAPQKTTGAQEKTYGHETTADHDRHAATKSETKSETKSAAKADTKVDKDISNRVSKAAAVLQDLTASADKRIPNELLERAEAIAVIPNMIKGAFGIGGRFGKGMVSQRADSGRWSPAAFLEIGGGSFGAQIGVSSTDLVLVFTDKKALNLLEGGKDLKLGVDAGVVAGPLGRSAEAGVNANLSSAIYAYSRSKGLFAGIALDGAVLSIDKDANAKVYGSTVNAKEILEGNAAANSTVRPFMDALDKVIPKKRLSQK
jgi:lipid-binding SYLF domain-containing protein